MINSLYKLLALIFRASHVAGYGVPSEISSDSAASLAISSAHSGGRFFVKPLSDSSGFEYQWPAVVSVYHILIAGGGDYQKAFVPVRIIKGCFTDCREEQRFVALLIDEVYHPLVTTRTSRSQTPRRDRGTRAD